MDYDMAVSRFARPPGYEGPGNQSEYPLVAPGTQQRSTLGVDPGAPPRATPKGILGVPWGYLYPGGSKPLDQGWGKYNLR